MKVTKNMRIALDMVMTLLIIAAMFVQLTGIIVHEIIGFTFFALIATHLVFSASWIKKTAFALGHGKTSRRRLMLSVIGILLAIVGGALAVSSIAISNILASAGFAWPFGSYGTWVEIHSISAYALCAVVVVHLATHWAFIASALKVVYAPSNRRRISAGVYASAILGVGALGVGALTDISPMDSTQAIVTADQGIFDSTSQQETTSPQQEQTEQTYSKQKSKKHYSSEQSSASSNMSNLYSSEDQTTDNGAYNADEETEGETYPTGFCTLCHKGCALSSPQCNRPYQAGLITVSQQL